MLKLFEEAEGEAVAVAVADRLSLVLVRMELLEPVLDGIDTGVLKSLKLVDLSLIKFLIFASMGSFFASNSDDRYFEKLGLFVSREGGS